MVGCSDLAWRLLCRRHGADLCYTEMFFAERFVADPEYRARKLRTCAEDSPLVVQFCGTDPATLAAAARLAEPHCAAVDLNLGCPLPGAHEGGFGAYMLGPERRSLLLSIVAAMSEAVEIPISCKIRLLGTVEETVPSPMPCPSSNSDPDPHTNPIPSPKSYALMPCAVRRAPCALSPKP